MDGWVSCNQTRLLAGLRDRPSQKWIHFYERGPIMKKFYIIFASIVSTLVLVSLAQASCGSSNCSLLTGSQEGLVNKGRFVFDLSYSYIPQDQKQKGSSDTSEVLVPKIDFENKDIEPEHHREFRTLNKLAKLDVSYGLTEKLTLSLSLPFFNDRFHEHDDGVELPAENGEFTNQDGSTGFGDISLVAKYQLWRTTKHLLIGGAGIKFASGEYELKNSEGDINEPTLMPGTGSYDAIVSGLYNYTVIPNKLSLFTSVSHRFTTENSRDYLFGDTTFVDGGASYLLTDKVNVSAQINARISRRDQFLGMDVPSTGGEFVFLTPGVRLYASENLSLYSHVQIPIYQRVNEVNLVADYGLLLGASYGF